MSVGSLGSVRLPRVLAAASPAHADEPLSLHTISGTISLPEGVRAWSAGDVTVEARAADGAPAGVAIPSETGRYQIDLVAGIYRVEVTVTGPSSERLSGGIYGTSEQNPEGQTVDARSADREELDIALHPIEAPDASPETPSPGARAVPVPLADPVVSRTISGKVTVPAGFGAWLSNITVSVNRVVGTDVRVEKFIVPNPSTGEWSATVPAGQYKIYYFSPPGTKPENIADVFTSPIFDATSRDVTGIVKAVVPTSRVHFDVTTAAGQKLPSSYAGWVYAYNEANKRWFGSSDFSLQGLPAGKYWFVLLTADENWNYSLQPLTVNGKLSYTVAAGMKV